MHTHLQTLHGGVGLTMASVRELVLLGTTAEKSDKTGYTKLLRPQKISNHALANPSTGSLPKERTEGSVPFKYISVDFAGLIKYLSKSKREMKTYIVLYACCLTRAVYLEILSNLSVEEFIRSIKRLISRRGRPEKIFSDNGKTFVAWAKWLRKIRNDEKRSDPLAKQRIAWQFNLSRAPWWGGGGRGRQFERLIGVMKQSLCNSIGNGNLRWHELDEVILDVEITLNNRPSGYVEDDVQMPFQAPSTMLYGQPNQLPEEELEAIEEGNLRKRAKYLKRCKDVLWSRWTREYLKALREATMNPGDVVLIKGEERNRGR